VRRRKPVPLPPRVRTLPRLLRAGHMAAAALVCAATFATACGKEDANGPATGPGTVGKEDPPPLGVGPKHFVNTKDALLAAPPELKAHFLPFSFDLPEGWGYEEGGSKPARTNFVKIERRANPRTTAENFSVGVFWSSADTTKTSDEALTARLEKFKRTIERSFPAALILADATRAIDGRRARGFRFSTRFPGEPGGEKPLDAWGLVLFVPDVRGTDGAVLIMMGSTADTRFASADDVGEKGDVPKILASFKFGE